MKDECRKVFLMKVRLTKNRVFSAKGDVLDVPEPAAYRMVHVEKSAELLPDANGEVPELGNPLRLTRPPAGRQEKMVPAADRGQRKMKGRMKDEG